MLSMLSYSMEYPFDLLETFLLAVSPPKFLFIPSLLIGEVEQEAENATSVLILLSTNKNIPQSSVLFLAQAQNIDLY